MDRLIIDAIKDREKWELFPRAAAARMLFGLVQTPSELVNCPQLASRNFYREVDHPVIGKIKVPAELFKLSETPYQLRMPAPTLGQHNQEIYVEGLGYTRQELVRLRQLDVI
jgi:crotonobetainyl-CoA:carnitine CoA-transferase CaiB-like acyl-CoA transferase